MLFRTVMRAIKMEPPEHLPKKAGHPSVSSGRSIGLWVYVQTFSISCSMQNEEKLRRVIEGGHIHVPQQITTKTLNAKICAGLKPADVLLNNDFENSQNARRKLDQLRSWYGTQSEPHDQKRLCQNEEGNGFWKVPCFNHFRPTRCQDSSECLYCAEPSVNL